MDSSYDSKLKEMEAVLQCLVTAPRQKFSQAVWHDVRAVPGLYLIEDKGAIVYIGSAQNLNTRLWQEHYLGRRVRPGGSQLRGVLAKSRKLGTSQEITDYIGQFCSFAVVELDPINKRDLRFLEDYCNAVVRPELIEYDSKNIEWVGERILPNPIQYKCTCCGRPFPSGRQRQPPYHCKTCAEEHRAQGKGPFQVKKPS
ncbi:MAG: hypothetical protein FJ005_09395 [Chloroflexi bacterium]|nr:hypothetical protein [Chloroflexota bacterium]